MDLLDIGLYAAYALVAIAVLTAIIFPVFNAIKTPAALVRALIGIGILLAIFGISYALSDSNLSVRSAAMVGPGTGRLVSAGLIMMYISLVLAAIAVIYSEISKAFR